MFNIRNLFKVNNKDKRATSMTSSVFIVNFEQILHIALTFPLLEWNKSMPARSILYSHWTNKCSKSQIKIWEQWLWTFACSVRIHTPRRHSLFIYCKMFKVNKGLLKKDMFLNMNFLIPCFKITQFVNTWGGAVIVCRSTLTRRIFITFYWIWPFSPCF